MRQAVQQVATPPWLPLWKKYGESVAPTVDMSTHTHGAARAAHVVCVHMQVVARRSPRTKPMSCCRIKTVMEHWQFEEKKRLAATSFHKI
jgi:hypothetical protein